MRSPYIPELSGQFFTQVELVPTAYMNPSVEQAEHWLVLGPEQLEHSELQGNTVSWKSEIPQDSSLAGWFRSVSKVKSIVEEV